VAVGDGTADESPPAQLASIPLGTAWRMPLHYDRAGPAIRAYLAPTPHQTIEIRYRRIAVGLGHAAGLSVFNHPPNGVVFRHIRTCLQKMTIIGI
jgi:hypothetical protein